MIQTQKMTKNIILGLICVHWVQIQAHNIFFLNLAASVTKYHGHLSSSKISEKTNLPIWRKFSDRRTNGQIDRQRVIL